MLAQLGRAQHFEDVVHAHPTRAEKTERLVLALERCSGAESASIRSAIVEVNMNVARTLARRYHGRGERPEDLEQTAYLGLTKAAKRFDPRREHNFLAFAVPTVLGELRRHFRDSCWVVRPPRRIQELQTQMMSAIDVFAQRNARNPSTEELAAEIDTSVENIVEALTADGCFTPSSLDKPVGHRTATPLGETLGDSDDEFERAETKESLRPLIEGLPDREHRIIELRFYWGWT